MWPAVPLLSRQKDEREDLDLVEEIEREFRIYSSHLTIIFQWRMLLWRRMQNGDTAIFSAFGINLFRKERDVCETRIVDRGKSFYRFGF